MTRTEKIKIIMVAFCVVFTIAMMSLTSVHAETAHHGNVQNTNSDTIRSSKGNATSRTDSGAGNIIIRMGAVFIVAICVLSAVFSVLRGDDIKFGPILFLLLVAGGAMLSLSR